MLDDHDHVRDMEVGEEDVHCTGCGMGSPLSSTQQCWEAGVKGWCPVALGIVAVRSLDPSDRSSRNVPRVEEGAVPCHVGEPAFEALVFPKGVDGFGCTWCGELVLPSQEGHYHDAAAADARVVGTVSRELVSLDDLLRRSLR